ncbi:MAG: Flp family type IVb pilin [Elusimicrobia bacterium]|nr:Flp family type IVb pilin [Elusimicrobiota bacterium]
MRALTADENGQGMTEYILLIFLIAIACMFGVRMYGGKIKKGYNKGAATLGNLTR